MEANYDEKKARAICHYLSKNEDLDSHKITEEEKLQLLVSELKFEYEQDVKAIQLQEEEEDEEPEEHLILSLCADGASALGVLRSSRKLYRWKGVDLECENPYLVVPVPGRFTLALAKGFKMVKWGFLVQG